MDNLEEINSKDDKLNDSINEIRKSMNEISYQTDQSN